MTKRKLLAHLQQPSTWRGIVLICSALGFAVRPDVGEAIIAVGLSISGLIGVLSSEPGTIIPAPGDGDD